MSVVPSARITGIGTWGPGLAGWAAALATLRDPGAAELVEPGLPQPTVLPSAERRRATPATRLALTVAAEAIGHAGLDPARLASVFSSSAGNPEIIDALCAAVAAGDPTISPTRFHNSVHNAAAGYFGIGAAAMGASTSLCAGDDSAAAGLLEALVQVAADGEPVLYVSCDLGYPFPLSAVRPIVGRWAVALVLAPPPGSAGPRLHASLAPPPDGVPDTFPGPTGHPGLDAAVAGNPTARLLPLLRALACGESATLTLPLGDAAPLRLRVEPA